MGDEALFQRIKEEPAFGYFLRQFEDWWGMNKNAPWCPTDPRHWDQYLKKQSVWQARYQEDLANKVSPEEYYRQQREQAERRRQEEHQAALTFAANAWEKIAGPRYVKATFNSFVATTDSMRDAVDVCREYAESFETDSGNLILFGACGTGKDHLAVAICQELLWKPYYPIRLPNDDCFGGRWTPGGTQGVMALTNGNSIFSAARDAMKAGEERHFVRDYVQPTLLVISDPAPPTGEPLTGYQAGIITQLIDQRYTEMLPTVITINCRDRDEMDKMLTPPIADRLCHGAITVPCDWPSYRKAKR